MTKPIVRDPIYRRRRFDAEIIELCVRWHITYRCSNRDLAAMDDSTHPATGPYYPDVVKLASELLRRRASDFDQLCDVC
jgi:hypothetical protein